MVQEDAGEMIVMKIEDLQVQGVETMTTPASEELIKDEMIAWVTETIEDQTEEVL